MRLVLLAGVIALAGCSPPVREDRAREIASGAAEDEAEDVARPLRARIEGLERELADNKRMLDLVNGSLQEARENHTSLRKTFNDNVKVANDHDRAIQERLDQIDRRLGIYR